ncbi:hypothetical protein HYPSUDRAFT_60806 [Hypholoma sublateritium FD-334 SS-4]|uniref:Phospholipid/glycerol acyltransferase domain-containing protein n=1 Tax=Hypholoma sublateritium (strain FD-334 SS-4) TaxID=945553 RepID=A0A0D2N0N8_HYPSF|nr:hypothetical protein HYPSUDRAFT_60806 [Hypholoma sublateritium FD-334 SS-4]
MEKFSAYRDPGTGIQPFLTPVPPLGSEIIAKVTLPLRLLLGIIRTTLVLSLALLYVLVVRGVCLVFFPIPPLRQFAEQIFTYLLGRTALLILGFLWILPEQFNRKRGRGARASEAWNVKAGDIIVSNWSSWIEIVWLAIQYNPVFVIPIPATVPETLSNSLPSTPVTHTPGRRTGTGSANIQVQPRMSTAQTPITGFKEISLLSMINFTGRVPMPDSMISSLEDIRSRSTRPVVVFPECTTSNGRGLLRFAEVFYQTIPVKGYQVFIMSIRYDPPTPLSPTLTHTIPYNSLNPLPHLFWLCTSLSPAEMSIRLLAPSDSPGNQLFMASEILADYTGDDQLSETCASLIAQMGKLKRMGMGWEDKTRFFEFYKLKANK